MVTDSMDAFTIPREQVTEWLRRVWSPGLLTDTFTDEQRRVWQLDPAHDYLMVSTGGDATLDDIMRRLQLRRELTPLFWAWRTGGYWVLCPSRLTRQEAR